MFAHAASRPAPAASLQEHCLLLAKVHTSHRNIMTRKSNPAIQCLLPLLKPRACRVTEATKLRQTHGSVQGRTVVADSVT